MTNDLKWFLALYGPIAVFAALITLYDWLAQRQHRRQREREQRRSA